MTDDIEKAAAARHTKRLTASVPRYTSYPTAPHFHQGVGESDVRGWLEKLPGDDSVSVYIHIPFCDRLCWFCGCHTKQINRYDPIPTYLKAVEFELALVREAIGFAPRLRQLHLGGGSPSMLRRTDLKRLRETMEKSFRLEPDAAVSIEIDPSDLTGEMYSGFEAFGITRASIGVQDFDPRVQEAINRPQTFEQTAASVDALRRIGVKSLNIDALYGLPYQSVDTVAKSIEQVASLSPDRIALFGYAHVPWMKKHQNMIPDNALPGPDDRLAQARVAAEILVSRGYVQIGIDHFARPLDTLAVAAAAGRLRRNFQGYTDDPCPTLLGIGASSISRLPQGYVQNETATGNYMRCVSEGKLPAVRGIELTPDDEMHADVIEQLMCQFGFSLSWLRMRHGRRAQAIVQRISEVQSADEDGLTEFDGERFMIRPSARHSTRIVASWFDARLHSNNSRYSVAV